MEINFSFLLRCTNSFYRQMQGQWLEVLVSYTKPWVLPGDDILGRPPRKADVTVPGSMAQPASTASQGGQSQVQLVGPPYVVHLWGPAQTKNSEPLVQENVTTATEY